MWHSNLQPKIKSEESNTFKVLFILWPWLFLATMQTCQVQLWVPLRSIHFYQEVAATPLREILSTLQLTSRGNLFFLSSSSPSSFLIHEKVTPHTEPVSLTDDLSFVNPHTHTPVTVQSCDNTACVNVSHNREFACACLHTVPIPLPHYHRHPHSTETKEMEENNGKRCVVNTV